MIRTSSFPSNHLIHDQLRYLYLSRYLVLALILITYFLSMKKNDGKERKTTNGNQYIYIPFYVNTIIPTYLPVDQARAVQISFWTQRLSSQIHRVLIKIVENGLVLLEQRLGSIFINGLILVSLLLSFVCCRPLASSQLQVSCLNFILISRQPGTKCIRCLFIVLFMYIKQGWGKQKWGIYKHPKYHSSRRTR